MFAGPAFLGAAALGFMFLGLSGMCTGTMTSDKASMLVSAFLACLGVAAIIWIAGLWLSSDNARKGPDQ
jgi:hypothetical protein